MKKAKQTCSRRMSDWGTWERKEGLDTWEKGHGLVGVQGDNLSCSFCGSLHPDTFMAWMEAGGEVTPTDKSYKAYIKCPLPNPRYGEVTEGETEGGSKFTQVYGSEAKFYFQHLSDDQKRRFVGLYNDRTMKVGYPGHFYQSPFFMVPADK
jgi:hypothetical protein